MKKIIPLALVLLMVVAMAVPVFADTDTPSVSGVWVFNDTVKELSSSVYVNFSCDGVSYDKIGFYGQGGGVKDLYYGSSFTYVYRLNTRVWFDEKYKTIDFGETQIVTETFYTWLTSNATPVLPPCDGSSCPATDLNADGVCDDCGAVLRLIVNGYPSLPVVDGANQHSVYTEDAGGRTYYVFYSNFSYTPTGTVGEQLTAKFDSNVNYKIFRCTDGKNWVETVSSSGYQYGLGYKADVTIVGSTFNFYDESGNLFFPLPLWVEVLGVTQGEIPGVTNQLSQTMLILVLCGVGCLALLIGLHLFGKVLRPYLG